VSEARESVRVRDWLALRVPVPPSALAERIADSIGDVQCERATLPAMLVDRAVQLLRSIGSTRDSADDLLAADALITYAIEAAIENCADLEFFAALAAKEIAANATAQSK
jgi:hypothetical protein